MKKVKPEAVDDLRPDYGRDDFTTLVRGKYAARLKLASNVVVLLPEVAKVFPNAEAANGTLTGPMIAPVPPRAPVARRGRADEWSGRCEMHSSTQ